VHDPQDDHVLPFEDVKQPVGSNPSAKDLWFAALGGGKFLHVGRVRGEIGLLQLGEDPPSLGRREGLEILLSFSG